MMSNREEEAQLTPIHRKLVLGGFAAGALVLAGASVAYACVPFRGQAQVNASGAGTPQNSSTFIGNNETGPLGYCGNTGTTGTSPGSQAGTEAQVNGGGVITVSVATASACNDANNSNRLSQGLKSVIINNAKTASASPFTLVNTSVWSIVATTGCFTSATPQGNITLDTAFSVDATGSGTKTYTLPSMNRVDGSQAASSVCVGTSGPTGRAIFVPLKIEATI